MSDLVKPESKLASVSSAGHGRAIVMRLSTLLTALVMLALIGISFYGGVLYGRGQKTATSSSTETIEHRFALGQVLYIDPGSITISNEYNTYNQTFSITSNTQISINGKKADATQLQAGDIVLIRISKANPSQAAIILANTHFKVD